MAPDFEYFVRFKAQSTVGHTLGGFLFYNLPLVFLVALLWHYVVKQPLILSLPNVIKRYFISFLNDQFEIKSVKAFVVFIISAIAGMTSHVLWDAFTHTDAFFVVRIPLLSQYITIFGTKIAVYKILQHGSTFIGSGIILAYLYFRFGNMNKVLPKIHRGKQLIYWVSVLLIALGVVIIRAFYTLGTISFAYYGIYIVSFISGAIMGVVIISSIFKTFRVYEF